MMYILELPLMDLFGLILKLGVIWLVFTVLVSASIRLVMDSVLRTYREHLWKVRHGSGS